MNKDEWKDEAPCKDSGYAINDFFDNYEEDIELRQDIDALCFSCPLARHCFAVGVSQKGYGVWGGVYIENGKPSREFNRHRTKADWAKVWQNLVVDKE